jgi:hypothetical protein
LIVVSSMNFLLTEASKFVGKVANHRI